MLMRDYRELHQLPRSDIVSMGTMVGESKKALCESEIGGVGGASVF